MRPVPLPANTDEPTHGSVAWDHNRKILEWLNRFTRPNFAFDVLACPNETTPRTASESHDNSLDDWQSVTGICGYGIECFIATNASLPLTAAEIEHFRRNHRGTESHVNRDFLTARSDLPSPLAELYGLYLHRARVDAEAALFLAQSTHSTRVARIMADLLAIGSFANSMEFVSHLGVTYSVPTAFDTSDIIDRANHEAARRLDLPSDNPSHLLKLTPDEIGALASTMAEKYALCAPDFMKKANLLAEARQDVNRMSPEQHFATAYEEGDIPSDQAWGVRIRTAFSNIFPQLGRKIVPNALAQ